MRWAIIDTSVYINHWERGLHDDALGTIRGACIIRQSSIVLSELRRGARTVEARRLIEALFRSTRIQWAPSEADWWEAGRVIQKLGDARGWDPNKRQAFQNDTLIVLTARRHGATIVTANRVDFELLGKELGVSVFAV